MLKELIDQLYLDKQEDREQNHFYITDAGKCARAIFFKFKNMPREKMEARMLRLFDHGDYIQMQLLSSLFSLGIVRASEVQIPPQALISGRADAIVTLNNELYVVDFKSMNSMIFRKLQEPKEENINQIQLYMHYFQIPKGILLYMSKDTSELKDFPIQYNTDLVQNLLKGLESLDKKIKANIIPEQMLDFPRNRQCVYCQFKDICISAGKDELKWDEFKSKVEKLGK
ncbi:MAG: PD-(D/E)XK nuclease family protein [Candidatus Nealsonbacteria bacterium]